MEYNIDTLIKIINDPILRQKFIDEIMSNISKEESDLLEQNIINYSTINNNKDNQKIYFRLNNRYNLHRKFRYKNGLNFDTNQFNPSGNCSGGGLYFCELNKLHTYIKHGNAIRPVFVPKNIPFYHEEGSYRRDKYKAPILYLLPKIKLGTREALKLFQNGSSNDLVEVNEFYMYLSDNIDDIEKYIQNNDDNKIDDDVVHAKIKKLIIQDPAKLYSILINAIDSKSTDPEIKASLLSAYQKYLYEDDVFFTKYLRTYFFPQFLSENDVLLKNNKIQIDVDKSIKSITLDLNNKIDPDIVDLIRKYDGIISGSFALKHYCNLSFISNDIDIYFDSKYMNEIDDYFHINGSSDIGSGYPFSDIQKVLTIKTSNNINIQYIFVKGDPFEFIKNNFDFNFCMCGFDFNNNFRINETNDINNYNIGNITESYIDKIIKTMTDSTTSTILTNTIERIIKYTKRGFTITNLNEFLQKIETNLF